MDDLRWALLGLGGLFLAGLAWWELRKPRHSGRKDDSDAFTSPADASVPIRRIEPRMGDPSDGPLNAELPSMRAVEAGSDPPVLMLGERRGGRTETMEISIAADVAIDAPGMRELTDEEVPPFEVPSPAAVTEPVRIGSAMDPEIIESTGMQAPSPVPAPAPAPRVPRRTGPPDPQWPPEDQRRIVSLRLVPRPPARFAGRTLRMAFDACGLEFGAFNIFHLVDEDGDVFASAANLMRPGSFTPTAMDGQYYHGVHLFCVLPGPLPAGRAVDELIALARDLAQRLAGIVLDDVGQPLDEERAAAVRAAAEQAESVG